MTKPPAYAVNERRRGGLISLGTNGLSSLDWYRSIGGRVWLILVSEDVVVGMRGIGRMGRMMGMGRM